MRDTLLVRDIMTSPVTTLPRSCRLLDAALTLRRTGYRHVIIVEDERIVGVVSDRDVHRFAPSLLGNITPEDYNAIFENTPVERVMTREPLTVAPTTSLNAAATIMHERKLGCLPVVEEGRLVGLVTISDMLGVLTRLLTSESQPVPAR